MTKQQEFIRVKDAAKRVGIRTETMYDWVNRNYFPAHRIGRMIYIRASDFEAFLERTKLLEI
jgi:excisionase family DNA binding protein